MRNLNQKGGASIIGVIFLAVIIILVLSYFHISVKSIIESPTGQENLNYVGGGAINLWNTYLSKPFADLWNYISPFIGPLITSLQKMVGGQLKMP